MILLKSKETTGIFFVILAYFSFSLLDAVQKTAVMHQTIFQLLLAKYIFVLFLSLIESYRMNKKYFYKSKNIKLQILRGILSIVESGCFILAFKYLSLANAHSIGSLTPVIVVALSAIILRERVNLKTWVAIFFGFLGVLIIMRPGLSIFDPKSLIPLGAAFFLSLYQIVTRKASEYDTSETSLLYTSIVGIVSMSFLMPFFWYPMQSFSYFLFLGVGLFFSLGIYFQIIALGFTKASIVQPFHYTLILWAIILGYIFYDDFPDIYTIVGAAIITLSGIYVLMNRKSSE